VIASLLPQHITIDTNVEVDEEQLRRIVEVARQEQERRAAARAKAIRGGQQEPGRAGGVQELIEVEKGFLKTFY
jgi:hypothetical protein